GKIVVVSFIYTNCPDICPLTTARLAQVEEKLGDIVGRDIFLVSLTVDPERDTPERLKSFATAFGAGPGWLFLTGKPEDIRAINDRRGAGGRTRSEHRKKVSFGNEGPGGGAGNAVWGAPARMTRDFRARDQKGRARVPPPQPAAASDTVYRLDLRPG